MKVLIFIFLCLFSLMATSQDDTLVIAQYKFPLRKQKVEFTFGPDITLPKEYQDYKYDISIPYKAYSDSTFISISDDKTESIYTVYVERPHSTAKDTSLNLRHFVDTIKVNFSEFDKLTPYIKSNKRKIVFHQAKILTVYKDTISEFKCAYIPKGNIFEYRCSGWDNYNSREFVTHSTYIITELYYYKGLTTYYLDRQFVIIVK